MTAKELIDTLKMVNPNARIIIENASNGIEILNLLAIDGNTTKILIKQYGE